MASATARPSLSFPNVMVTTIDPAETFGAHKVSTDAQGELTVEIRIRGFMRENASRQLSYVAAEQLFSALGSHLAPHNISLSSSDARFSSIMYDRYRSIGNNVKKLLRSSQYRIDKHYDRRRDLVCQYRPLTIPREFWSMWHVEVLRERDELKARERDLESEISRIVEEKDKVIEEIQRENALQREEIELLRTRLEESHRAHKRDCVSRERD
jgi:hypothetical protein